MSSWLVVTTGDVAHQDDVSLPPLRDDGTFERWLDEQPETHPPTGLWAGRTLTAEVYLDRREGPLMSVSFSVSRRGEASRVEHDRLCERLRALAGQLGGRLWDDDLETCLD